MRILVTGGAGYIGSHTAKALARAGYEPVVLDNLWRGNRWAVRWGPLIEMDLADRKALVRVIKEQKIGAVLHFAGSAYIDESMRVPSEYFNNNVVNALNLLEAMRETELNNIVFSSTCAVYGTALCTSIPEDYSRAPVNPYGESKLMIERMLEWYGRAYNLHWTALRYFNAAGADPEGEIGEVHNPETHIIPRAIAVAHGDIPDFELFGNDYPTPDGTAIRDYIHVTDLALAHVKALQRLSRGGSSGAMNLGTGIGRSIRQVIAEVERVAQRSISVKRCPRRDGDPAVLIAAASLATRELGWTPIHSSLGKIVETAWDWHASYRLTGSCGNLRPASVDRATFSPVTV